MLSSPGGLFFAKFIAPAFCYDAMALVLAL